MDENIEIFTLKNMLIDYKLKLIVAKTLREGHQNIIINGDQ